jgi:hypothetical protein
MAAIFRGWDSGPVHTPGSEVVKADREKSAERTEMVVFSRRQA